MNDFEKIGCRQVTEKEMSDYRNELIKKEAINMLNYLKSMKPDNHIHYKVIDYLLDLVHREGGIYNDELYASNRTL